MGRRMIMVHGFRRSGRSIPIVPCQFLNITPKWKQPGLKIMLSDMRMESRLIPNPQSHLLLCILGVGEIVSSRVNVR